MATYRITDPNGKEFDVTAPDGASQDEVLAYAQKNFKMAAAPAKPKKGFGEQLNDFIADVPRQAGLTARYGLEGVGNMADFVTAPIRGGLNALGANIKPGVGQVAADALSLPQPRTAGERVVGDASRLLAGAAIPLAGGAALASNATGAAAGVGRVLASNPGQQLASAAGSGLAGGITRETGGNDISQAVASLAGGIAAPYAVSGAGRLAQSARNATIGRPTPSPQQIDITINNAIGDSGLKLADLPAEVAQGIRQDVQQAYKMGDSLNQDAVRRLADYRLTGLTPTNARLTLDPADITRQANLAKLGANSRDPAAQALARTQNANNKQLTTGLNEVGANTADDQIAGAAKVMDALSARNSRAKAIIDRAYQGARDTQGRAAALDPSAFTQRANDLLDDALLGGKLPSDVRGLLNRAASGEMPLTVDVAEQFKTRIGELQRSTIDMAERKALGMVRSALDDTPLLPGQDIGQESIDAFNKARRLNRSWMGIVDKTPALQAVRDGIEPDRFVQQFIVGNGAKANVMDVAKLKSSVKSNPEAMAAIKEQIAAHLKSRALSGADDEVGNFSQSGYNKALNAIGDRKLRLFFSPEELNQLKAIGRVSSYEQVQPVGSAVNNSNTAGAVGNILERLGGASLLNKIPFGRAAIGDPVENIILSNRAGRALDAPRSLLLPQMPQQRSPVGLSPAALIGTETEEDRKRREMGLLSP